MLLKSEEFWKDFDNDLMEEDNELIALHRDFMLRTYRYITGNITNLPVSSVRYAELQLLLSDIGAEYLSTNNYMKLSKSMFSIVEHFKEQGTKAGIRKAIDFLKKSPYGVNMIAVSGVLNGVLETDLSIPDYVLVMKVDRALQNIIQGKEVDDIG